MRLFRRGERASTLDLLVAGPRQPGARVRRRRGTTSAGWCSTSSRAGTAARGARSSPASSPRCASTARSSRSLKPETYMNESGRSLGAAARFFKAPAGDGARRPRRRRPRGGAPAGARSAAASPATTACARSRSSSARRSSCGCGSASAARAAATAARSPTTCSRRFEPETDVDALVARAADAVETIVRDGLVEARSSASTERVSHSRHALSTAGSHVDRLRSASRPTPHPGRGVGRENGVPFSPAVRPGSGLAGRGRDTGPRPYN